MNMKTDHRYRNVDIEVCLNFPTVEDIVVKWLGKIIMNHDGISKNGNDWNPYVHKALYYLHRYSL